MLRLLRDRYCAALRPDGVAVVRRRRGPAPALDLKLMNTEISHLKGGKFRINVFIGVALVAFIRDTLIMTLKHEQMEKQYYFIALISILGVVFWLVKRAEERSK